MRQAGISLAASPPANIARSRITPAKQAMTACPTVKVSQHTSFALLRFVCRFHFAREENRNNKKNPYFLITKYHQSHFQTPRRENIEMVPSSSVACQIIGSPLTTTRRILSRKCIFLLSQTPCHHTSNLKKCLGIYKGICFFATHFSRFESTTLKISLACTPLNPTTRSLFTTPPPAPLKNIVDSFRLVYAGKCTITSKTNRIEVRFP